MKTKGKLLFVLILVASIMGQSCQSMNGDSMNNIKANRYEKMVHLPKYTEYKYVIDEFGEPDEVVGSGFLIIEYHFDEGKTVGLNFGGKEKLLAIYVKDQEGKSKEILKL